MSTYTSQYPVEQNSNYVRCKYIGMPYHWTDPSSPLTGSYTGQEFTGYTNYDNATVESRLHIDLGLAKIIRRIYYENFFGYMPWVPYYRYLGWGVKNFTLFGSNDATVFSDVNYSADTGWNEITGLSQSYFDKHVAANSIDPKYITFDNTISYRFYAVKIQDRYYEGDYGGFAFRRIELQTEDGYYPPMTGSTANKILVFNNSVLAY
jgi:hypothetical protein